MRSQNKWRRNRRALKVPTCCHCFLPCDPVVRRTQEAEAEEVEPVEPVEIEPEVQNLIKL